MQLADLLLTTRALTPAQHANWRASFALPQQTACAARGDPMESLRRHFRLADHYRIAPAQVSKSYSKSYIPQSHYCPPFSPSFAYGAPRLGFAQ